MKIMKTLFYYFIAYSVVTLIASLHFLFNWKVRKQEAFDTSLGLRSLLANATKFEAFITTKPFHPIYNLLVFPIVSVIMMLQFSSIPTIAQGIVIGILWLLYCVIFDLIFWILIPHPWRLTLNELFVTYPPWITLAYVAIAVSPVISVLYITYFVN